MQKQMRDYGNTWREKNDLARYPEEKVWKARQKGS